MQAASSSSSEESSAVSASESTTEEDNSEEIIERLKSEIRQAVGLTMRKDDKKKDDKQKRKLPPAPSSSSTSQKTYQVDLDLAKRDDRRRTSARREGSLDIDLTRSEPPRRKSESSETRINRTMFETVIDNELKGDDWEATIEDLRRECQKLGPNAPKLPYNDPRDKLKALMKIAEARWKYMTWLMAEANPEEQAKYKRMRQKST